MTDPHSCTVAFTLRHVVTCVQPKGVARKQRVAFPAETWFTLDADAQMFGLRRSTVYTLLSRHRAKFDPPTYRQRRRNGDFRLRRIVNEHDISVFLTMFSVLVKQKDSQHGDPLRGDVLTTSAPTD